MRQEITIIVLIDVQAAINANTLEGNIYMIDNLRNEGSIGEGTGHLVSAINGAHWLDGTQADEQILNWTPAVIGSLPSSLPKSFHVEKSRISEIKEFKDLPQRLKEAGEDKKGIKDIHTNLQNITKNICSLGKVKDTRGNVKHTGLKVMNVMGEPFREGEGTTSELSHFIPQIDDITGEAVDKGVIFPAQYGTPISIKDGWYWSATADTNKVGTFAYTMHITLYKLSNFLGEPVWEPINMTYESHIKVTNVPKNNAFTNGAVGMLPIL
ncbi:MAG: hypothetical protein KAW12_15375 [Candidatus Aminicenantes bacterium]|nr:hypothetical protein [Candidatus Aminicenantes bacterium]